MKKLLYLLLVLPFALMISSCSSDDDLPDVKVTMSFDNAAVKDGSVYVVKTDTLKITNIETKALNSDKAAALVNVDYFWNGIPAPGLTFSNFPLNIPMEKLPLVESGANILGMRATVLEVDKSMAYCMIRIPVVAVDSADDMPDGLVPGVAVLSMQLGQSKSKN